MNGLDQKIYSKEIYVEVDFHCRVIFTCVLACEQALPLKGLVTSQEKKSLQRSHSFFSILRSESERKLLIGQFV